MLFVDLNITQHIINVKRFYLKIQPRLQGALSLKQKGPLKGVHGNRGSQKGR